GRVSGRADRRLNLMKETLTVRMSHSPALERGERSLAEYIQTLETGTALQVAEYDAVRACAVRSDIHLHRAQALARPADVSLVALMMNNERLKQEGRG